MSEEDKKILKYNHEDKSLKLHLQFMQIQNVCQKGSCQNNPEKSYTQRKAKHKPSGYSLSLISSFDTTKNRYYFYRGKYCIENFCKELKELGTEIIKYKEKEMIPLTDTEKKYHICKEEF